MANADPMSNADIVVEIGTSDMVRRDPTLPERLSKMFNASYFHALGTLAPTTDENKYERMSVDEVYQRLRMGDAGPRANRVLHVATRGGMLVGACSSTVQAPWCGPRCGHWGILCVDRASQGTGVARALVTAAECRLAAGGCTHVQIEYEHTPGHAHSERLKKQYEGKWGFVCMEAHKPRHTPSGSKAGEGQMQFRLLVKRLGE